VSVGQHRRRDPQKLRNFKILGVREEFFHRHKSSISGSHAG
jgi:hypothetical protein